VSLNQIGLLEFTCCNSFSFYVSFLVLATGSIGSSIFSPDSSFLVLSSAAFNSASAISSSDNGISLVFSCTLYNKIGKWIKCDYFLITSSILDSFKNSNESCFKNSLITVPLPKVLPLGSLIIVYEPDASDFQIYWSSFSKYDLLTTTTLSATKNTD